MTTPNVDSLSLETIAGINREANRIKRYIQGKGDQSKYKGLTQTNVTDEQLNYFRTNTALNSLEAFVNSLRKQFDTL